MTNIHPQARTTPKVRAEIQKATGTQREIAAQFNVTVATVRKWRSRDAVQDRSHRPNKLSTTLSPAQEAVVIELRRTLLPLDDLLVVTREFIHAGASRAALDRLLRRHGVSRLADLQTQAGEVPTRASKTFKSYEPGFVHIDIKYLPQMPDEAQRRYLFVAIDRALRAGDRSSPGAGTTANRSAGGLRLRERPLRLFCLHNAPPHPRGNRGCAQWKPVSNACGA